MKTITKSKNWSFIFMMAIAVSCSDSKSGSQQGTENQPKTYKVIELQAQSTTMYKDYPTTLQGQQTMEIRPKITGYIDEILVDEGAHVTKGQLLFRLFANDMQASV